MVDGTLRHQGMLSGSNEEAAMDLSALVIDPAIESYLAQVKESMRGLVPPAKGDMLLYEAAYWIQRRADMFWGAPKICTTGKIRISPCLSMIRRILEQGRA
jgi:hypothetical protein